MKLMFLGADHEVTGSAIISKPAARASFWTVAWSRDGIPMKIRKSP